MVPRALIPLVQLPGLPVMSLAENDCQTTFLHHKLILIRNDISPHTEWTCFLMPRVVVFHGQFDSFKLVLSSGAEPVGSKPDNIVLMCDFAKNRTGECHWPVNR